MSDLSTPELQRFLKEAARGDPKPISTAEIDFVEKTGRSGPKTLVKKLASIMAEIDFVEKTGRNEFHGYAYMKASDLAHAVRGKMAERNIIMLGSTESIQERAVPAKEGVMQLMTINVMYTVYDGDSGETLTFKVPGSGCDRTGEKSVYKAITGSQKYALRSLFLVPDSSDPEGAQIEKEFTVEENGKKVTKTVTVQPATRTEPPKIIKEETSPAKPAGPGVVSGAVEEVEIKETKNGAPYRRVKMASGGWYSCFDNKELAISDGGKIYMKQLFALLDNAVGVKCSFKTKESGKFRNIIGVKSIGFYEWDDEDGSPVIQTETKDEGRVKEDSPPLDPWEYGG